MANRNTKRELLLRYQREQQIKQIAKWLALVVAILAFVGTLAYTGWKAKNNDSPASDITVTSSLAKKDLVKPRDPLPNTPVVLAPPTPAGKIPAIDLSEAMKKYTGDDLGVASSRSGAVQQNVETTLLAGKTGIANLPGKRPAIEKVIQDFFQAATVEARLPFVRKPKIVRPYMEEYYARPGLLLPKLSTVGEMRPVTDEKRMLAMVAVNYEGGKSYKFAIEEKDDAYLLDWESLVSYSAQSWQDFQAKMPRQSISMRVMASMGDFYFGNYTDKLRWVCVEMERPFEEGTIYGYFSRTDPVTAPLLGLINAAGAEKIPLIVDLYYEPESRPNQAVVRSLLGSTWLPPAD